MFNIFDLFKFQIFYAILWRYKSIIQISIITISINPKNISSLIFNKMHILELGWNVKLFVKYQFSVAFEMNAANIA